MTREEARNIMTKHYNHWQRLRTEKICSEEEGTETIAAFDMAIEALKQEPEWIPVSERLPQDAFGCIVTVMDTNSATQEDFENLYPDFVGWDGETWNDADGKPIPFEVLAWMPLPEPYDQQESEG